MTESLGHRPCGRLELLPQDRLLVDVSLWSADLAALGESVRRMESHADMFHLDVSDNHFVPGLLFFPDLVARLRPLSTRPFHVHLMAEAPESLVGPFADAGADVITVQLEAGPAEALRRIRRRGLSAGLAVALDTDVASAAPWLELIDVLVLLGTRLGVKGQELAPEASGRLELARLLIDEHGLGGRVWIAADGGIRRDTAPVLRRAGADIVVAGSLVFAEDDPTDTFAWLRGL